MRYPVVLHINVNNRPLSYIEDDVELPVLTPNSMLNINPSVLPELKPHHMDNRDLRKRAKFMIKCKESVWKRWSREYVKSLRERHVNGGGKQTITPRRGTAVIIKDENKNRNTCMEAWSCERNHQRKRWDCTWSESQNSERGA